MYKIYINDRPLILCNTAQLETSLPSVENVLVARYPGKVKYLINYIDQMEKSDRYDAVVLHSDEAEKLIEDYKGLYKIIEAAGGFVFNESDEALMIHRLGWWDLPKGKIEKGEEIKAAAIREVEEETGIRDIELGPLLLKTYHTYRSKKNKRILKRTYWFTMRTKNQPLTPQTEEAIEQAVWRDLTEFLDKKEKVYQSILDVIMAYLNKV